MGAYVLPGSTLWTCRRSLQHSGSSLQTSPSRRRSFGGFARTQGGAAPLVPASQKQQHYAGHLSSMPFNGSTPHRHRVAAKAVDSRSCQQSSRESACSAPQAAQEGASHGSTRRDTAVEGHASAPLTALLAAAVMLAPLPAQAVLSVGSDMYMEDSTFWTMVLLGAVASALTTLKQAGNPKGIMQELADRWGSAELYEVRLDLTMLWIYACGRELARVVAWDRPWGGQIQLGFNATKLAHLLDLCGSTCALCMAWIACGIVTCQFERTEFSGDVKQYMQISWATSIMAGLLWQLCEQYLYTTARPDLLEAMPLDLAGGTVSILFLCAVMLAYRLFSWFVP
mmetsp:Transcript_21833/g.60655  ORF Transcript_21833/g.60655 Transcript_21833/m.60655 type:complete len:340 (-) Transcript_21833:62-1081(-)